MGFGTVQGPAPLVMPPITAESLPYIYPKQAYPTSSDALVALRHASELSSKGLYDESIAVLDVAIDTGEPNPYLHYNRAHSNAMQANYEVAVDDYSRCLELEPLNPTAWCSYAYSLARCNRQLEAIAAYTQAINQHPSEASNYFLRAASLLMAGDMAGVLSDIDEGKRLNGVVMRRLIAEVLEDADTDAMK